MPANFLIVCGGAGRGILSRFDELGFDGALQIDVQSELVQVRDGRVLTFGLPVSPVIEETPHSAASLGAYAVRLDNEWKKHHTQNHHKGDYKECGEGDCQNYQRQVKHVATARQGVLPAAITMNNGMSQNPIIGRSYITRPRVSQLLADTIQLMHDLNPANQQDVVVWLVASTCGGTGNGIVHHVADLVRQVFGHYQLTVKFVRIGGWSYQSIAHLTNVSTFWSVLTDYGYKHTYKKEIGTMIRKGESPTEALEFYYIDVRDVGANVHEREALVQSAFVAISNPTIDMQFAIRLNNGGGVMMARVGEWGNALNRDAVFLLTLRQLMEKMEHLLSYQATVQSYSRWLSETQDILVTAPLVVTTPDMQQRYQEVALRPAMQPILKGLQNVSPAVFGGITRVLEVQEHPKWQEMRQLVSQIFTETEMQNIERQVQVHLTIEGEVERVNLGDRDHADAMGPMYIASMDHIGRIRMAQRAKARIKHYLLGDTSTEGCIKTVLREAWNTLIPPARWGGLFVDDTARQTAFTTGIVTFMTEYFKVARCLALYNEAEQIIQNARRDFSNDARRDFGNVTDALRYETANMMPDELPDYTLCAELDEMFWGKTWLRIVLDAVRLNAIASGEFRRAVELGAIGLTEEGLKSVLEVHPHANVPQIVDEVNTNCGRNDAIWWQGMQSPNMWAGPMGTNYWFDYRIFPRLPERLFADLQNANAQWEQTAWQTSPRYMAISSPALGLKVYAVQGAAVAPIGDESLEIQQLVGMIIPSLSRQMPWYIDRARGGFSLTEFRMVQCTHSIGLPVRIPAALLENPHLGLKEIVDALEDCVTFDMDDRWSRYE